jgi:hypothetical protein
VSGDKYSAERDIPAKPSELLGVQPVGYAYVLEVVREDWCSRFCRPEPISFFANVARNRAGNGKGIHIIIQRAQPDEIS